MKTTLLGSALLARVRQRGPRSPDLVEEYEAPRRNILVAVIEALMRMVSLAGEVHEACG
jgi:hypothetical protein